MMPRGRRFRDLPLFAKLLVPYLTLMLFVGAFGVFLIVRELGTRAQASLDEELARRSLDARSLIRDRELYLLESVNFAANLEGVAAAVRARDEAKAARLLQSVVALKAELGVVAVTDRSGIGLAQFTRRSPGADAVRTSGTSFADRDVVKRALAAKTSSKVAGFMRLGSHDVLAIASPICAEAEPCASVGIAVVGIDVDELASAVRGAGERSPTNGVAVYATDGRLLARAGSAPIAARVNGSQKEGTVRGGDVATRYTPFDVQGRRAGTLALVTPTEEAFSGARGAGIRLALVLFGAMVGIVAIGAMLSRRILSQVRPLVETNRALGSGELDARAPVLSSDELGELAHGVNQMAEQLQASYETLELRVAQRTEEVQRLLKERTEFFTALSHELRTPLAIIRGQAKMMRDPTFPKGTKWVTDTGAVIDDSASQLLSLVNDILELARAEAGRLDVDIQTVQLPEVIRAVQPTLEGLARSNGLSIAVDVPKDLPPVRADRHRLREVIVNLVDNAAKYTPDGGAIDLSAVARNGSVAVSVADTGVGIPPEVGELIFEPFFRVRGTTAQRGQASTGLGLALAKRIVEAQGGKIRFESEVDVGTTFEFTLPLEKRAKRARKARR
jgi:signal transduction histidine kinase